MRPADNSRGGVTPIELLIILMVLMIVASFVLRVAYAHQFHEWEDGVWRSVGDPALGHFSTIVVVLVLVAIRSVLRWRRHFQKRGN